MPNSALMDTSWNRKRRRRLKLRAEGIAKINPGPDRMLYPLTFHPIFKERVWGGRKLEQLYHKPLPAGLPIGESWELSERPAGRQRPALARGASSPGTARHGRTTAGTVSVAGQDSGRAGETFLAGP